LKNYHDRIIRKNIYCTFAFKTILALLLAIPAGAQDKPPVIFGKVTPADFDLPNSNAIDSNSNAVIIADVGSVEFVGNNRIRVSYLFKKSIRIKILNKKGYDLSTVKIRLFGKNEWQDKMDDFHATTYNIENGKVIETAIGKNDLFDEKISANVNEKKFTMPDVREGSIIEYSYSITSYHYHYLPGWAFQNLNHPCLYSEYSIAIPDWLKYLILHYGPDSFYHSKSTESYKSLVENNYSVASVVSNQTWVMKNIPAFSEEDYINNPVDYLDRIEFILSQSYDKKTAGDIAKSWKAAENDLLSDDQFGGAISDNTSNLKKTVKNICSGDGDITESAKQIYSYVRDNFTCIPDDDIYIGNDLYDVNKMRKGTVAELNMLLVGLLREKGINANPVILSTKEYGIHTVAYPILEKMNYVVCMVRLGRDTIYLDASDPLLGFGKLPLSCYNGHAQIIDQQHSGALFFYPNTIKEANKTFVTIVNNENDFGASGSLESNRGYFESYDLRSSIKEKGMDEYSNKIKISYGPDIEIKNLEIDSLKQLESPVKIKYDINFKTRNEDADIIYFSPFISDAFKENPFKAGARKYPIEMPYPLDDTYELTMDIPKGYKVDELPKSVKVSFNDTDGFFEYTIQKDEYLVQLRSRVKLNQAIFSPEDYSVLRDFFAYVVKKQSEQIVFKKK
jgi:hypothetical protein